MDEADLPPVILIGHSSSTQVVAHVAAVAPELVHALALASPTVDPAVRVLALASSGGAELTGSAARKKPVRSSACRRAH